MFTSFVSACQEVMQARRWDEKVAKRKAFHQSLLGHSMSLVGLGQKLLELGIIQPRSDAQKQYFLLSLAVHDAGKESEAFQEYIGGLKKGFVSDTDVERSRRVAEQIAEKLGWSVPSEVLAAVGLHMKGHDTNGANLLEILRGHEDPEWRGVAQWVQDVDRVASARTPRAAADAWRTNTTHLRHSSRKVIYHSIRLRGVSSVFLHDAIRKAHSDWEPLIYYPFGTFYVSNSDTATAPTINKIQECLQDEIRLFMEKESERKVKLMHGDIRNTYFVKPDLLTLDDLRPLLNLAAQRIREQPAANISDEVVLPYYNINTIYETTGDAKLATKAGQRDPIKLRNAIHEDLHEKLVFSISDLSANERLSLASSLGEGRKEFAILKMFKNIANKILDKSGLQTLANYYDEAFGSGAFEVLNTTGNIKPAIDTALTVNPYWNRALFHFGLSGDGKVSDLEKGRRREVLIDKLVEMMNRVCSELEIERTTESLVLAMAEHFLQDIEYPMAPVDLAELAQQQLEAAIVAKSNISSTKEVPHLCPLCNNQFKHGVVAIADMINRATAFSNRITAYGKNQYQICKSCYFERLLQQLLLGGKPGEFICVVPSVHLSAAYADALRERVEAFFVKVKDFTQGPASFASSYSLALEGMISSKLQNQEGGLDPALFPDLFAYRKSEQRVKEERKKLLQGLADNFEEIGLVNELLGTEYASFEELADAFYSGEHLESEYFADLFEEIKTKEPIRSVFQTPNFMIFPTLAPMNRESAIQSDTDSEAKFAYKQLFIAALFAEYLDMSVAVLKELETVHLLVEGMTGRVYVPNHPRVRKEVVAARKDLTVYNEPWLSDHEYRKWREAIQAAILLRKAVGYSERDDLPRILSFSQEGELIRRIQMKNKQSQGLSVFEWKQVEKIFGRYWDDSSSVRSEAATVVKV